MTHEDAEDAITPVLRRYDVPEVSMLAALSPVDNDPTMRDFLRDVYFTDEDHPSVLGQRMVASVVGERLRHLVDASTAAEAKQRGRRWFEGAAPDYVLPAASDEWREEAELLDRGVDPTAIDLQTADAVVHASGVASTGKPLLTGELVVEARGWAFGEDVRGKPGLISNGTVGATVLLRVPAFEHSLFHKRLRNYYQNLY